MATTSARPPSVAVTGRRRTSSAEHGLSRPQGLAEVPVSDGEQPFEVLHVDRPVEPELRAQILEVLAVRLLLQHELDDVAGDQAGEREDDERMR